MVPTASAMHYLQTITSLLVVQPGASDIDDLSGLINPNTKEVIAYQTDQTDQARSRQFSIKNIFRGE